MKPVFLFVGLFGLDRTVTVQVASDGFLCAFILGDELIIEVLVTVGWYDSLYTEDTIVNHSIEGPVVFTDSIIEVIFVFLTEVTGPEVFRKFLRIKVLLLYLVR